MTNKKCINHTEILLQESSEQNEKLQEIKIETNKILKECKKNNGYIY